MLYYTGVHSQQLNCYRNMINFQLSQKEIINIKNALQKPDGIIAFPTDTVWGVGCLIKNEDAVKKIYSVKGRSKSKPLILLGNKTEHLMPYVANLHENALKIIDKYLPGAVTLVVPKSENTPFYVTSGYETVGIRIPDYPPLLDLFENAVDSHVLATTSSNLSNMGATASKSVVESTIGEEVDYIIDDYGFMPKGTESTVVSVNTAGEIKILRQGAVIIEI